MAPGNYRVEVAQFTLTQWEARMYWRETPHSTPAFVGAWIAPPQHVRRLVRALARGLLKSPATCTVNGLDLLDSYLRTGDAPPRQDAKTKVASRTKRKRKLPLVREN